MPARPIPDERECPPPGPSLAGPISGSLLSRLPAHMEPSRRLHESTLAAPEPAVEADLPRSATSGVVDLSCLLDQLHRQLEHGAFSIPRLCGSLSVSSTEALHAFVALRERGLIETLAESPYLRVTPQGHRFREH